MMVLCSAFCQSQDMESQMQFPSLAPPSWQ